MSMFLNYADDLIRNYVPNNISCNKHVGKSYTKLDPVDASKPFEEYDAGGNLIGYSWHQGESVNLEFNIDGEIVVENDAIIYRTSGAYPTSHTVGTIGQKAYNVIDLISWKCTSISLNGIYGWEQEEKFTYSESTGNSIYVDAASYLKNKYVVFNLYNFRYEPILTYKFEGESKIIVYISPEVSSKLVKGIYYCSLTVFNDEVNMKIFDTKDCSLVVK